MRDAVSQLNAAQNHFCEFWCYPGFANVAIRLGRPVELPVIAASLSASEGQDHGESVPGP
jgi:hypothetical protein